MDSVFLLSLPIVLTSFINKSGDIGINLLPMVLVDRKVSPETASLVLGLVKGSLVLGTLAGGWVSEWIGNRKTILVGFFLCGVGLIAIPHAGPLWCLAFFGMLAECGIGFLMSPIRLLLTRSVPPQHHQEALAWLRTGNNSAQVLSYSAGFFLSALGVSFLFTYDGITSLLAVLAGFFLLPKDPPKKTSTVENTDDERPLSREKHKALIGCTLIIGGFLFLYELFVITASAKSKIIFGDEGLKVFSQMMIINTVLCTLGAVRAARYFRSPDFAYPFGLICSATGILLILLTGNAKIGVWMAAFLLTAGEIVFAALSQYVIIRILGSNAKGGRLYSLSLTGQSVARIAGGVAAFPFIIEGRHPYLFVLTVLTMLLGVFFSIRQPLRNILGLTVQVA